MSENKLPHAKAPESLIPTMEWQKIQVAEFSEAKVYVSKLISNKSSWPDDVIEIELDLDGSQVWKKFFENNDPKLSRVLGLHPGLLDCGLEFLVEMIDIEKSCNTISPKTGQWIYALLASTTQPLSSRTIGILRSLAKKCAEIRSNLNPEDENSIELAVPLNVFICIVGRYFRQFDLIDY